MIASCLVFHATSRALHEFNAESTNFTSMEGSRKTNFVSVILLTIHVGSFTRFIQHYEAMPFVTGILVVWNKRQTGPAFINGSFSMLVTVV